MAAAILGTAAAPAPEPAHNAAAAAVPEPTRPAPPLAGQVPRGGLAAQAGTERRRPAPASGNACLPSVSTSRVMQAAVALAADGEIGNSDAIALLGVAHTRHELAQVLRTFDRQLTAAARSKLTLACHAPLPAGVQSQRFEPLFDRYPLSGRTYTTAHGAVVPDEVQYYNGEMVQVYGESRNVGRVAAALAGSGYKPLLLRYDDGRETAVTQFWAHQLSDTSLGPYNAMFIIVVAVPDNAPADASDLRADGSGASCVLPIVDGCYDAAQGRYTNRARLFYLRLLDSTQVAIDVGRERMGTDKRPGTIDRSRSGNHVVFSVRDGLGRGVAKIDALLTDDPDACRSSIVQAAAAAGVSPAPLPPGTELVYPGVARIGQAPVVLWDWRTDVRPRLQRVTSGTMTIDGSSEDGAILTGWDFVPRILGHLPNVRGVVTGVPAAR